MFIGQCSLYFSCLPGQVCQFSTNTFDFISDIVKFTCYPLSKRYFFRICLIYILSYYRRLLFRICTIF